MPICKSEQLVVTAVFPHVRTGLCPNVTPSSRWRTHRLSSFCSLGQSFLSKLQSRDRHKESLGDFLEDLHLDNSHFKMHFCTLRTVNFVLSLSHWNCAVRGAFHGQYGEDEQCHQPVTLQMYMWTCAVLRQMPLKTETFM